METIRQRVWVIVCLYHDYDNQKQYGKTYLAKSEADFQCKKLNDLATENGFHLTYTVEEIL